MLFIEEIFLYQSSPKYENNTDLPQKRDDENGNASWTLRFLAFVLRILKINPNLQPNFPIPRVYQDRKPLFPTMTLMLEKCKHHYFCPGSDMNTFKSDIHKVAMQHLLRDLKTNND